MAIPSNGDFVLNVGSNISEVIKAFEAAQNMVVKIEAQARQAAQNINNIPNLKNIVSSSNMGGGSGGGSAIGHSAELISIAKNTGEMVGLLKAFLERGAMGVAGARMATGAGSLFPGQIAPGDRIQNRVSAIKEFRKTKRCCKNGFYPRIHSNY